MHKNTQNTDCSKVCQNKKARQLSILVCLFIFIIFYNLSKYTKIQKCTKCTKYKNTQKFVKIQIVQNTDCTKVKIKRHTNFRFSSVFYFYNLSKYTKIHKYRLLQNTDTFYNLSKYRLYKIHKIQIVQKSKYRLYLLSLYTFLVYKN